MVQTIIVAITNIAIFLKAPDTYSFPPLPVKYSTLELLFIDSLFILFCSVIFAIISCLFLPDFRFKYKLYSAF